MTVTAPPQDIAGAALDTQIATLSALVNAIQTWTADMGPPTADSGNYTADGGSSLYRPAKPQYIAQLNALQVAAVEHYMITGWLNAATILATYSAPVWDKTGAALTARVAFLQALVNNAPAPLPGNVGGYGGAGWVTVLQNYQQQLYAAQIALVERIMDVPGGTSAATILAAMTGAQSFPFEYTFTSVGFTDAWIDG